LSHDILPVPKIKNARDFKAQRHREVGIWLCVKQRKAHEQIALKGDGQFGQNRPD
jgi:hypothetical protein